MDKMADSAPVPPDQLFPALPRQHLSPSQSASGADQLTPLMSLHVGTWLPTWGGLTPASSHSTQGARSLSRSKSRPGCDVKQVLSVRRPLNKNIQGTGQSTRPQSGLEPANFQGDERNLNQTKF